MEPSQHHRASLGLSLYPPHPPEPPKSAPQLRCLLEPVSHTGMLRGCSFLQGPGGARPGSEWKRGHFLADAPMPPGCRARAPIRTFGQLIAKAQPPPSLCTISTVGNGRQCGAPLKLRVGFRSTFHPLLPTGCRFPMGSSFYICLPTVFPRPGITVIVRLENTYYAPSPPGAFPLT